MKFSGDEFVPRMHIEFVGDDDGHDGERRKNCHAFPGSLPIEATDVSLMKPKTRRKEAGRVAFCRPRTITTCRDETCPIRTHSK